MDSSLSDCDIVGFLSCANRKEGAQRIGRHTCESPGQTSEFVTAPDVTAWTTTDNGKSVSQVEFPNNYHIVDNSSPDGTYFYVIQLEPKQPDDKGEKVIVPLPFVHMCLWCWATTVQEKKTVWRELKADYETRVKKACGLNVEIALEQI
ncbi:hypothetical protein Ddc_18318 [Ditylenchus destructor]|nr:hypothetical protein Ddc_18318 [Ditylenchus destructor]